MKKEGSFMNNVDDDDIHVVSEGDLKVLHPSGTAVAPYKGGGVAKAKPHAKTAEQGKKQPENNFGALKKTATGGIQERMNETEDQAQKKGRIGERMVALGLITADQLNVAIQEKKISGKMLGEVLV